MSLKVGTDHDCVTRLLAGGRGASGGKAREGWGAWGRYSKEGSTFRLTGGEKGPTPALLNAASRTV